MDRGSGIVNIANPNPNPNPTFVVVELVPLEEMVLGVLLVAGVVKHKH